MANPFVTQEVMKVLETAGEYPKNIALATAWIIANFKGINIKIFDVKETSSLCDYNIIATATNTTQASTMVDEICYNIKQSGAQVRSIEGMSDCNWILIDLGDIIVHIFQETSRDIIDLDGLWRSSSQLEIPQDFYFSHPEIDSIITKSNDSTDDYF